MTDNKFVLKNASPHPLTFWKFMSRKWVVTYTRDGSYFQDFRRINSQTCHCIRSKHTESCSGVASSSKGNLKNEMMTVRIGGGGGVMRLIIECDL